MNVLWIAYQPLPAILHEISPETQIATGGWLQGAADIICRHKDICLTYCFQGKKQCQGTVDGIAYYSICEAEVVRSRDILKYREKDYIRFKQIIDSCNPDVIQIFGTETWFQRQFVFMLDKMNLLDRTVDSGIGRILRTKLFKWHNAEDGKEKNLMGIVERNEHFRNKKAA